MDKYISVGKILNFHGIKGEAKVGFSRGQEDFILGLKEVYIRKDNEYIPFVVQNVRLNKNFALFKFEGIDSINELMDYKGSLIFVEENFIRENLEENEFLIDELVGMSIYDNEGNKLGFVIGVSNNGANDLLSVKTNTKHVSLIPFVGAFIQKVDIKEKAITINNIAGLLE